MRAGPPRLAAWLLALALLLPAGPGRGDEASPGASPAPASAEEPAPGPEGDVEADPRAGSPAPDPLFGDDELFGDVPAGYPDPIEPVNRGVLVFNDVVDRFVFDPLTVAYQWVVPGPARRGIRRIFLNLNSPSILVNDVIQLEWQDAGVTLSRFVINSTVGVAGIFDVAAGMGLDRHDSDFGQTLRLAEIGSGPYLVLPVFGPTTLRDASGQVIDAFFNPATYVFGFFGLGLSQYLISDATPLAEQIFLSGTEGLSTRDQHYESLKALKDSSVDLYSALRSAYYQNREAEIWHRRRHRREDWSTPY